MGGITPAVLIFSGRKELSPPYMRLPCWRLGYCTKRRRCARSKKTMASTTPTDRATMNRNSSGLICPVRVCDSICHRVMGRRATMPAKMIRLEPLPTPRLVICSPIHIRNRVPPVSVATVEMTKPKPGVLTRPWLFCRPSAMPKLWMTASSTVR